MISWEQSRLTLPDNNDHAIDEIDYAEYNLPLEDMQRLNEFEGFLKDKSFADKVVKYNIILYCCIM